MIEVFIWILFLVLIVPQLIHWMTLIAKYKVKQQNKVILQRYKETIRKTLEKEKHKKDDKDLRGYA